MIYIPVLLEWGKVLYVLVVSGGTEVFQSLLIWTCIWWCLRGRNCLKSGWCVNQLCLHWEICLCFCVYKSLHIIYFVDVFFTEISSASLLLTKLRSCLHTAGLRLCEASLCSNPIGELDSCSHMTNWYRIFGRGWILSFIAWFWIKVLFFIYFDNCFLGFIQDRQCLKSQIY